MFIFLCVVLISFVSQFYPVLLIFLILSLRLLLIILLFFSSSLETHLFCLPVIFLMVIKCSLQFYLEFYFKGKLYISKLAQAVDPTFFPPAPPLRNPHPTGTAKGCRGAARDIVVVALAGHNTACLPSDRVNSYGRHVVIGYACCINSSFQPSALSPILCAQ